MGLGISTSEGGDPMTGWFTGLLYFSITYAHSNSLLNPKMASFFFQLSNKILLHIWAETSVYKENTKVENRQKDTSSGSI